MHSFELTKQVKLVVNLCERPFSASRLRKLHLMKPLLPILEPEDGFYTEDYNINGHLYGRLPSGNYLITISCCGNQTNHELKKTNFKLRIVSKYGQVSSIFCCCVFKLQVIDLNPDPQIRILPEAKEIRVNNKLKMPKRKRKSKPGFFSCCF